MTYYICPEEPVMSSTVMMRSCINTRINSIGIDTEYAEDKHESPEYADSPILIKKSFPDS